MTIFTLFALLSFVAWILLALRITGYDEKLLKIGRPRTRERRAYAGKRLVVTGASSGIGAELALQYARMGARICLGARRPQKLEEVRQLCLTAGAEQCECFELDVTNLESCQFVLCVGRGG